MRWVDYQGSSRPSVEPIGTSLLARKNKWDYFTVFLDAHLEVSCYRLATIDWPPYIGALKHICHAAHSLQLEQITILLSRLFPTGPLARQIKAVLLAPR
jgi:hypothetical protein